jgi:outer membrane protein TolC
MCKRSKFLLQFKQNKYVAIFIVGMTLFWAAQAGAAQETTTVLKLEQAITLALKVDNDVLVAANDLAKAQLAVDLEKINNLPSASGDASAHDYFGDANTGGNLQLKVQQTIPTKWHLYGADTATEVETKRWAVTKSEEALRIARAKTVNDVTNLYYSALKAQKTLKYQQLAVDYARAKADYNKLQLQYGKVTKTTQLTAENDYMTARYEWEKDQQAYRLACQKLASQIGRASYQTIVLDQTLLEKTPGKIEYEKQKQQAILERPEIKQYQVALKTAEQEWAVAKNNGLPSLDLSFQNRGELQSFDAQYDFLSGDLSWSTGWQKSYSGAEDETMENFSSEDMFGSKRRKIGLTLSWDLDFGSAANETKQAAYAVESAKRNLEQSYRDIALEIDTARSEYEAALVALDNSKAGIPLYEKTVELAKLQKKMGMMTAIDLQKAELDLASSRTAVETTTCDLLIAIQKLKLALGQLYNAK